MEMPIVAPALVVTEHTAVFRDLFDNQCRFRHGQHYLTRLIVLSNKSMANIARCVLDSADKTNLSRFLSEAPCREDAVIADALGRCCSRARPIGSGIGSRWWSWMILRAKMWAASLIMWTATITTVMAPIPWPITRSPACL